MVKKLAKLSLVVIWKIENVLNNLVDLPKSISKQDAESVNWHLLSTSNKLQEKKYELKREMTNFQAELVKLYMQIRLL